MSDVRDMRRVEWRASGKRPEWCILCWDAGPTQPHPRHPEEGLLVCERCAQWIGATLAKERAAAAELDRHGYQIGWRLRSKLIQLLFEDVLPDASRAALRHPGRAWWAGIYGFGPKLVAELEQAIGGWPGQLTG